MACSHFLIRPARYPPSIGITAGTHRVNRPARHAHSSSSVCTDLAWGMSDPGQGINPPRDRVIMNSPCTHTKREIPDICANFCHYRSRIGPSWKDAWNAAHAVTEKHLICAGYGNRKATEKIQSFRGRGVSARGGIHTRYEIVDPVETADVRAGCHRESRAHLGPCLPYTGPDV